MEGRGAIARRRLAGREPNRGSSGKDSTPRDVVFSRIRSEFPFYSQILEAFPPQLRPGGVERERLTGARMLQSEGGGMQGDRWAEPRTRCERQPAAVRPIADDRTATAGKLGSQLVAAARRGLEFDKRYLARAFHDAGPHMAFPGRARQPGVPGLVIAVLSVVPLVVRADVFGAVGGKQPGTAFLAQSLQAIVPVDPPSKRRRKPPLDHREVGLSDESLAKHPRQFGSCRPRCGEHENPGNGRVQATYHAQKPSWTGCLHDPKNARSATRRIGGRQAGGLDDGEDMVILEDRIQRREVHTHDASVASQDHLGKRISPPS